MAVASVRGVVWEWQRDDGGYSPYYPEVIQAIENARTSGQKRLNLGTVSKSLAPYKVDLAKEEQIRSNTGMVRCIRRSEVFISGTPCYGLWEWQDGSNNFNIYNVKAIIEIEEAFQLKQPTVDLSVKPSRLPYTIDFTTLYQTRHHYNTRRKIRRTQLSKPLQSYLTNDTTPPTAASFMPGSIHSFPLENSTHSVAHNGYVLSSAPGSVYNVSMPSVYSSRSSSTTSTSAMSQVTSFNTAPYKSSGLFSATPEVDPNLYSTMTTTSAARTSTPSEGHKGEKASTNVTTRSSPRAKKSVTMDPVGPSEMTTSKSAKRCKTKVKRPPTNG